MYDFDESGVLTLDEMVLSFRSSLSGLAKLTKIDPPTETEVETIVVLGFDIVRSKQRERPVTSGGLPELLGIDREAFVSFCLNTPEVPCKHTHTYTYIQKMHTKNTYKPMFQNLCRWMYINILTCVLRVA